MLHYSNKKQPKEKFLTTVNNKREKNKPQAEGRATVPCS